MLIEDNDRKHLLPATIKVLCETRVFLSRLQGDREAKSLLERVDSIIRRYNDATRQSGKREAEAQG